MAKSQADARPQFRLHASVLVVRGPRLLLVQEDKAESRGRWNLPGGHIEHGEDLIAAADRELREETDLVLEMEGLVGIYRGTASIRFVFQARMMETEPTAGDEILAVRWFTADQIRALGDEQLVSPRVLRQVVVDAALGRLFPLAVFSSVVPA